MRVILERAVAGEVAGRLFNRALLPPEKDLADFCGEQWRAQATISTGGGLFSQHEAHSSSVCIHDCIERSKKGRSTSQIDGDVPGRKQKNSLRGFPPSQADEDSSKIGPEEQFQRLENGFLPKERESRTIAESTGKELLPRCSREETAPSLPRNRGKTQCRCEPQLQTLPSAMITKKRPRQRKVVTFAGTQFLFLKSEQTDTILRSDFYDVVAVSYIPHLSGYTKEASEKLWYTREELKNIKDEFVYQRRLSTKGRSDWSHRHRLLRHQRMMNTVLQEQERQRRMCYQIYGKIIDPSGCHHSSGILDPERLSHLCSIEGKSMESNEEASMRAQFCLVPRDTTLNKQNCDARRTTSIPRESSEMQSFREFTANEESTSVPAVPRSCFLDFSMAFGDCIDSVFSTLLAPCLVQRSESLFLEIGEEMLVE